MHHILPFYIVSAMLLVSGICVHVHERVEHTLLHVCKTLANVGERVQRIWR